jgi:hypothetical protein
MTGTAELVQAICLMIKANATPVPITLMNRGLDEAASIIGAVVERCERDAIPLSRIYLDPELGRELGLDDGKVLQHGARPTICWDPELGRSLRFETDRAAP